MLVRRALVSAARVSSTTTTTISSSSYIIRRIPASRLVPVNHQRQFGNSASRGQVPSFISTRKASTITTTSSSNSNNMGGKGVLIAVKPDGSAYSSSSNNEALSSLGLEASALSTLWKSSNAKPRPAEVRLFYGMGSNKDTTVALVGVGKLDGLDQDAIFERTRAVAATGVKALREVGCTEVQIDASTEGLHPHSAAVAVQLALHKFDWKTSKADVEKKTPVSVSLLGSSSSSSSSSSNDVDAKNLDWQTGQTFAYSQNLARELMDTPANLMTPTVFAERAEKEFKDLEGVTVNVYDEAWAKEKKMNTFLSVAAGTDEPAKFVEIIYKGAKEGGDATDVAFVGKGITFDSGGISIKPGAGMKEMRADMGGAACVLSSMLAIAKLKIPINMVVCIPLTENMPSGKATKPGDIIVSMAGKTIEVDNTDAEGRLVLADALYYASSVYKPKVIIDVATLTGAMMIALGDVYAGAFVTSDKLWEGLRTAGLAESDEFWRMPFDDKYLQYINKAGTDLVNTGGRAGGSCTAAIFLKQFVDGLQPDESPEGDAGAKDKEVIEYAHIDIAGVMSLAQSVQAYDVKGMSGKPVRALTEYIRRRAYKL